VFKEAGQVSLLMASRGTILIKLMALKYSLALDFTDEDDGHQTARGLLQELDRFDFMDSRNESLELCYSTNMPVSGESSVVLNGFVKRFER
jgi:hypothetical protein